MANPIKGEASLGKYTLAFNFGKFCALEERMGKKVPEILVSMTSGLGFGELRDCVAVGLEKHHPDATQEDVMQLLEDEGYKGCALAVSKAVGGFFGERKEKGDHPTKRGQGGAGPGS